MQNSPIQSPKSRKKEGFPPQIAAISLIFEFKPCRKMLANWRPYILNAFDIRLSNGFTEGCNNAIKTLKRLAFGFRSFAVFRTRILFAARAHSYI